MMKSVSDIMMKNFKYIGLLEGVKVAQDFVINKGIDFFPVVDEGNLVGILTYKHLIGVHSNRIVADAMSQTIISISSSTPLWQAKEIFEEKQLDVALVIDNDELLGIITKTQLYIELGKHVDLLTELYKSDYIYYYAKKLIKNEKNAAIIFIDINNFGYIDKKYGHIKGDLILKKVAFLLKSNTPSDTFLCRFGGDEFVVLTPYYLDECIRLTETLLNKISKYVFPSGIKISASAGISIIKDGIFKNLDVAVSEFINKASLASTKAKIEKCSYSIAQFITENRIYEIN